MSTFDLFSALAIATFWSGAPSEAADRTSYEIGIALALAAIVAGAWVWRLLANAANGFEGRQQPLWCYVGYMSLWFGALGMGNLILAHHYSPVVMGILVAGLFISAVAVKTGNLKFSSRGSRRPHNQTFE